LTLYINGTQVSQATVSGNTATFNISNNNVVPGNGSVTYLVSADFSNGATGTYQIGIAGNSSLMGTDSNNQNAQFTVMPVPLRGGMMTLVAATSTPTPSSTPTNTPVNTNTPTPVVTSVVENPYPNPSTGGPVTILVEVPGSAEIKWSVFTTAFRKVVGGEISVNNRGTVVWDLKDKNGAPVADGIYYVRVEVDGSQPTVKIFKVLVIR